MIFITFSRTFYFSRLNLDVVGIPVELECFWVSRYWLIGWLEGRGACILALAQWIIWRNPVCSSLSCGVDCLWILSGIICLITWSVVEGFVCIHHVVALIYYFWTFDKGWYGCFVSETDRPVVFFNLCWILLDFWRFVSIRNCFVLRLWDFIKWLNCYLFGLQWFCFSLWCYFLIRTLFLLVSGRWNYSRCIIL